MLLKRIAGLQSPSFVSAQAQRTGGGREVRLEFDRIGNAQELPLLLQHGKEFTEVLVSPHPSARGACQLAKRRAEICRCQRASTASGSCSANVIPLVIAA